MIINSEFKCLPVKIVFHTDYYDGPLAGICEYHGQKLYFRSTEEIWFKYAETDPAVIAITNEDYQFHSLRIYTLYKLPQDIMDTIVFNHDLFEKSKLIEIDKVDYENNLKKLPDYFNTHKEFIEEAWKYAIGYTTDDVWDNKEWLERRLKKE